MRVVLDTHTLLWYANGDQRLKGKALELLSQPTTQLCVSMASLWELSIKESLGKLELQAGYSKWAETYVINQPFELIGIESNHLAKLATLEWHHRDPFDRLILAQCVCGNLELVTHDKILAQYAGVKVHLI